MASLHAKPVRAIRWPAYPTRLDVGDDPELLRRLPSRWRRPPEVVPLARLCLAAHLADCDDGAATGSKRPDRLADAPAIVAPLFEHGEGRGATGCVVLAPPVFLSEEDGLQIIRDELAQAGVECTESYVDLDDVMIRRRRETIVLVEEWVSGSSRLVSRVSELPGSESPLNVDMRDAKKRVAIEFVSRADYDWLNGARSVSTVQSFDLPEVARYVSDQVREQGAGYYFAAFYDPMIERDSIDPSTKRELRRLLKQLEKDDSAMAGGDQETEPAVSNRELLRRQVQDFVEWLKGQGAI